MVFDGYSDSGRSRWTHGWFPSTGNVIYNISENFYFSKNSDSKNFSHVLLETDRFLDQTCISRDFRGSKGFLYKIDQNAL